MANDINYELSFLNPAFLKSVAARPLRILSEYLDPADRMRRARIRDTIVFFGSARSLSPEEAERRMAIVRDEIDRAGEITPELKDELSRAEYAVKMSRYYRDAMELARLLTEWTKSLTGSHHFIVCSGGSGGMMEAANRGAAMAGGKTVGLHIDLTTQEIVNPYVTPDLVFRFHYFFMRKFWLLYLAKALVVFPGGFGPWMNYLKY
jgi:predicted Rossmann-fold nucleotide-binding protein